MCLLLRNNDRLFVVEIENIIETGRRSIEYFMLYPIELLLFNKFDCLTGGNDNVKSF